MISVAPSPTQKPPPVQLIVPALLNVWLAWIPPPPFIVNVEPDGMVVVPAPLRSPAVQVQIPVTLREPAVSTCRLAPEKVKLLIADAWVESVNSRLPPE